MKNSWKTHENLIKTSIFSMLADVNVSSLYFWSLNNYWFIEFFGPKCPLSIHAFSIVWAFLRLQISEDSEQTCVCVWFRLTRHTLRLWIAWTGLCCRPQLTPSWSRSTTRGRPSMTSSTTTALTSPGLDTRTPSAPRARWKTTHQWTTAHRSLAVLRTPSGGQDLIHPHQGSGPRLQGSYAISV